MKKTITVSETHREAKTVTVEFPVYSKHDLLSDHADSVRYMRWDADGMRCEVHRTERYFGGEISFELSRAPYKPHPDADPDYVLGRGEHTSSKEEFDRVLDEAQAFLDEMRQ